KPENIMVRPDGLVKIVDFGIAKRKHLGGESLAVAGRTELQTSPGLLVGTPRYMSPEQARGFPVDARSDLFSLGSVLYEALTATPAAAGTNPSDILVSLLSHAPLPLERLRPQCPAGLVSIVRRALEKDLEKRYQSAEEMLIDLTFVRQDIHSGSARPLPAHSGKKGSGRKWQIAGLVGIAALAMVATRIGFVRHDASGGMGAVTGISAVTTYLGDESQPSLSPDGKQVAFTWEGENGNNRDIYITSLSHKSPHRLTNDPAEDVYPAWSPDGKQIAFIRRYASSQAEIVVISALGGKERRIKPIRLGSWLTGRMLAWSANAKYLCFTDEVGTSGNHALFLLSLASGIVRRFSPEQDNGEGDSSPAFSPDGHWLAFSRYFFPYASTLLLQRLSPDLRPEGRPLIVKDAGINPKAPVWTKDGRHILFLEGAKIMRAEIGKPALPFYASTSPFSELTLANAGPRPRLIAALQNQNDEIWTLSLGSKGAHASANPKRIVFSTRGEGQPRFSPDGRWLAFRSGRSGTSEIWLADADGGNARQLTHLSAQIAGYPHWSPDGQSIAFHARFPAEPQLYTIRIPDGVVRQVTSSKPGFTVPSWSLDGKMLYACALVDGETQIYSVRASGGVPKLLWKGAEAIAVPKRNLLLYNKEDEWGIYARSLTGNAVKNPEHLLAADYRPPWGSLVAFEDGFYYAAYGPEGSPRAFRFYSFDTGKTVDVAPAPYNLSDGLSVTPDRTRLVFSTRSHEGEDLVQLETK
ncbi:MAG TPA: protein kinase, partial [Bryobacteraceae bacterium]|nr:protein kinase [Bryobacteraceae bacterium]